MVSGLLKSPKEIKCAECGKDATVYHPRQRFCSDGCRLQYNYKKYKSKIYGTELLKRRACPNCNEGFVPHNESQRFCKKACYNAFAAKNAEKRAGSPPGACFEKHEKCYRKEAEAILQGKNTSGKNRCVKLVDDV
jgi:endogenous inhibitor of DNA gyrase (YacG/DUF329 family)